MELGDRLPAAVRLKAEAILALPPSRFVLQLALSLGEDDVSGLAAEMAYRFLFAIFPFLIFLAAVVGFISARAGYGNLFNLVMGFVSAGIPPEVEGVLTGWVSGVLSTQSPGLLTFGAAGALWGASGGIGTLIKGLNRAYRIRDDRPFWQTMLLGLLATVSLTAIMIAGVTIYTFGRGLGQWLADGLGLGAGFLPIWERTRTPVVDVGLILMLFVMYRRLPNTHVTWREAAPGAIVATAGWIGLTSGFSAYVAHFGSYDRTFGSLGTAVVLMVWMYMVGMILLFGGELNAAISRWRNPAT